MTSHNSPPRFIKLDLTPQDALSLPKEQEQLLKSFMLQSVHLDVSLNEFASHGALTFVFKNPVATPVEMRFAFPLMDGGAVITGISTEWDGHRITGRVRASEEGKKEYSDAVAKGHTASLVEHAENDLFMWRVGGIPGGSTVTVVSKFCGPVIMNKKFGKKAQTEITLTLPAVVPPWYGRAGSGDEALAFDTANQAPACVGSLALAPPPFTATVRSHFITQSLQAVAVTSPTHGPPHSPSTRSSPDGLEVSFHDLFKAAAGRDAVTNLQLRWVADGIVPNMACLGSMLAGVSSATDTIVSNDAAAVKAMEAATAALASGPHAADAEALLEKTKIQQRQTEQVCCVLYSEHNGQLPERVHVTVLVDCSGSMFPHRIGKARKALRALLTSLEPTSTFSVFLFGSSCRPVVLKDPEVNLAGANVKRSGQTGLLYCGKALIPGSDGCCGPNNGPQCSGCKDCESEMNAVLEASADNIDAVIARVEAEQNMGGTELFAAVKEVLRNQVPDHLRHNIMILTDGEVGQWESNNVKDVLAKVCPAQAIVGIIGIGNEVTRTTLRTVVEGGLGPQAIVFDSETEESIASIVVGSVNALVESQLQQVNWPHGKLVGSQRYLQCNSSEVCAAWALYPEEALSVVTPVAEDEEWEVVTAACSDGTAPHIRWSSGATVSIGACPASTTPHTAAQLPTLLVTDEDAVKSMCIAAALARCRHPSCPKPEATKLALRYGFLCAEADTVMVALSDNPATLASAASFGIAMPSSGRRVPSVFLSHSFGAASPAYCPSSPLAGQVCSFNAIDLPEYVSDCEDDSNPYYDQPLCRTGSWHLMSDMAADADDQEVMTAVDTTISCADSIMLPSLKHQRGDDVHVVSASVYCPSLLDVLGALQRGSWSLKHPVVAAFLSQHLPAAAAVCNHDAHATVAVIVVLRSKFKHSKAGWRVHVKRAAKGARAALGDAVYYSHKALVAGALGA
jgi:Mg-chelatase subunit ChlD